jgi:hypothetical protein
MRERQEVYTILIREQKEGLSQKAPIFRTETGYPDKVFRRFRLSHEFCNSLLK